MDNFPLYILASAVLHVTEEYFYPGGFLDWARKIIPRFAGRLNVKFAIIVNVLFLLLCTSGVIWGGRYPMFALSIAGLVLVNGSLHFFSSIATKSYSPGLITSLILYIPLSVYLFVSFNISFTQVLLLILYGVLYHGFVPLLLFSPFNNTKTGGPLWKK
jgi:Protein of unknown function with HXXEE motif